MAAGRCDISMSEQVVSYLSVNSPMKYESVWKLMQVWLSYPHAIHNTRMLPS